MNSKLEPLYHDIARSAMSFCERDERKSEFRRICDILRSHFNSLQRTFPPCSAAAGDAIRMESR